MKKTKELTILSLTVFLLLSAGAICAEQPQLPDTPTARECAAWLASFNRGDRDIYKEFLQKNFPSHLQDIERDLGFRDMTGGFEFRKVEESAPTKLVVLVQERASDQFARLTMEVEPGEPHRITRMDLLAILRPPEFALPPRTALRGQY